MKKRILSIVLCLCMVLTLLPTAAFAASTITPTENTLEALTAAFAKAQNGDTVQLTGDISTKTGLFNYITVSKSVTLDLNGHKIIHNGSGTSSNAFITLFQVLAGGTLTLKGGTIELTNDYSLIVQNLGKLIVQDGTYTGTNTNNLFLSIGAELIVNGGTLSSDNSYPIQAVNGGKLSITDGTIISKNSSAIAAQSNVAVTMIGGKVTGSGEACVYIIQGTSFNMSGGTIENTGSGRGVLVSTGAQFTMTGGAISASSGFALQNQNTASVSGSSKIKSNGIAVANFATLTIGNGADIQSTGSIGIVDLGNFSMSGGTVSSAKDVALRIGNNAQDSTNLSGGTLNSATCPVVHSGAGTLKLSGTSLNATTQSASCLVSNQAGGTVNYTGGSLNGGKESFINNSTGTIKLEYGNIPSILNYNANGKVVVDGGSVKSIQGTSPKNSAGAALRQYPIKITGKANTDLSSGELAFTPGVSYKFAGVKTDADAMVYPWLPVGLSTAMYGTGDTALKGGLAGEGSTTVLPNITANIIVYKDGVKWTDNLPMILLSTENVGTFPTNRILPDGGEAVKGVYTFSGLQPGTYYIWAPGAISYESSGIQVTGGDQRLDFYTVNAEKTEGISNASPINQAFVVGSKVTFHAALEDGFTFKNWTDKVTGNESGATLTIDKSTTLVAHATLNIYDATVTVNKDNTAWTNTDKTITLSTSMTDKEANKKTGTASGATVSFTGLDPRVAYYVWAGDVLTDQTISNNSKTASVDYYSVTLAAKDASIASVSANSTVLEGGSATINATPATDRVFSRWQQTTGGALYSTTAETKITNITAPISLTAVGTVDKYTATVTVQMDGGNNWTAQGKTPHILVLSASNTECGAISGTFDATTGKYTFAKLSGSGVYYLWDADTMQCVDKVNTITDKTSTATVDYYTVGVTKGDNITAVTGAGIYLKGSTVTLDATPAQYYKAKWKNTSTNGETQTIANLSEKTTFTVSGELAMYTGKVTLKLDEAGVYTGKTVTLHAGTETAIETTEAIGVYSSKITLDPTKTYKVLVNGTETGASLTGNQNGATVQYYTVSVTADGVGPIDTQYMQAGKDATFTAVPNSGFDFMGWFDSDNKLLSTELTYTLSNITAKKTLTTKASNKFDAVITLNGASGRSITLDGGASAATINGSTYTFSNLTRGATFRVLDNGEDTGFTVSKNAPNVTLQYYSVELKKGMGIDTVKGDGAYLAGSSVAIEATVENNYAFSNWKNGDTVVSTQKNYTIPAISGNMKLNATASGNYSGGAFNIATSGILIEDSTTTGKIKITYNSTTFDNLEPNTNITITGISSSNTISVTTQYDAMLTLDNVNITSDTTSPMSAEGTGTLTVDLVGTNTLKSTAPNRAGLRSYAFWAWNKSLGTRIIQSSSGTGSLTATGGAGGAGIGSNGGEGCHNIIVNSGTIHGTGTTAAGIGTGYANSVNGCNSIVTINGGTVTGTATNGAGIGAGQFGTSSTVIINGGTVTGNSTNGAGIGSSGNCNNTLYPISVTINGGTVTGNSTKGHGIGASDNVNATVTITGGNISGTVSTKSGSATPPINTKGESVYKTTFSTETDKDTDVSKTLLIRDNNGTAYGMNDVKTFAGGAVYAYLPESSAGAVYSSDNYAAKVTNDGNGKFNKVTEGSAYTVSIPAPATTEGVTASGTMQQVIPSFAEGVTVKVNVSLSGTALKPGTYTVGLTGTSAGAITSLTTGTTKVAVGTTPTDQYTFTFTMPAKDVSDLAVSLSFVEDPKHTVTYSAPDATGGSVPTGGSYYTGQTYTVDNSNTKPERTGYTFTGWAKGGAILTGSQPMGSENVIFTAKWIPNAYTVKLHSNDSTESIQDLPATYDQNVKLSNPFSRIGYTFAGWAETKDGAKKHIENAEVKNLTSVADAGIHLYALWTPKTYTVTFQAGGGMGNDTTQSFARDVEQELSANTFTKDGYTFAGWKKDTSTTYQNGASITVTSDMILVAQWVGNSYTVKFDANGGSGTIGNQTFTYGTAQALTQNSFNRTGYTFAGWNTKADGKGTFYANNENGSTLTAAQNDVVTLYAVWTANGYTVKFNPNQGNGSMSDQNLLYDAVTNLSENTTIIRPGYTFAGWNTNSDGTGTSYPNKASVKNLSSTAGGSVTLYAIWSVDVYTITFDAGGGSGTMATQTFATGDSFALRTNAFTKSGYHFTGWKDDKAATVAETATVDQVGRSTMLTAQWTANSYTVKFDANGGSGTMSGMSSTYGTAQHLSNNSFSRDGYKFLGWSESPTAITATYVNQASVENLTPIQDATVTLYAVWESDTFAVSFFANGGEGIMGELIVQNGKEAVLPDSTFTRNNFKFFGWNTQADGKGIDYPAGASASFTPDSSGRVSLYARWTNNALYKISGTVKDDASPTPGALPGADVTLKQGNTVIATTKTNALGQYTMINILPGNYNLVTTKDGKTVTTMVIVVGADVTTNVTLPTIASNNSVLVVTAETGLAPAIVVGGLEKASEVQGASIIMTVTAKPENKDNTEQSAIKVAAGSQKLAQFLDITLKKGADDIGNTNATVLEIVQPFSFNGRTDVKVWRYHGGTAEKLKKLDVKPHGTFEDGTYFTDSQNSMLYVYAKKFSTYAVSYQEVIPPSSGGGSGGSGSTSTSYAVMMKPSENGTIKANKTTATLGEKVIITATPGAGYSLKSLTITDASGKNIAYSANQDGTFTFSMPNSSVTILVQFGKHSKNPFVDVADTAYYYDAVLWAVSKGVTNGTSSMTFSPDMTCTRAQTVTFLWRSMGSPEPTTTSCPFTDVAKDSYYYKAVRWAVEKGITIGTSSTTFSPDDTVIRCQTATFLWRTAGKSAMTATNPFADVSSQDYYENAVLWAVSKGITNGTSATTFSPNTPCSRAQIVTFLHRYLNQ